jgi:hypothetical protein
MVLALLWFSRHLAVSRSLFVGAALTKDVSILTPLGLSFFPHPRRWLTAALPIGALIVWALILNVSLGNGFTARGNLSLPLSGLLSASGNWSEFDASEWVYLLFAIASAAAGVVVGITSRNWLRWSVLAWAALGLISSSWVWDFGNNAARVLAPLAILIALNVRNPKEQFENSPATKSARSP